MEPSAPSRTSTPASARRSRTRSAVAQSRVSRARARTASRASTNGSTSPVDPTPPAAAASPSRTMRDRKVDRALSRSGLSSPPWLLASIAVSRSSSAATAAPCRRRPGQRRTRPRGPPPSCAGCGGRTPGRAGRRAGRRARDLVGGTHVRGTAGRQLRAASASASIGTSLPLGKTADRPSTRTVTPPRPETRRVPRSRSSTSAVWLSTPRTNVSAGSSPSRIRSRRSPM